MRELLKELLSPDGKRKIEVFRREDGTFGFSVWALTEDYLGEMYWFDEKRDSKCIADTAERAEAEARGRVSGLWNE